MIKDMLKGKKILYVDIETTGLAMECAITQIAGIIEIGGEVAETFDFYVKPLEGDVIEEGAMEISGITLEQLESAPTAIEVHDSLVKIFSKYINRYNKHDKFTPAGYNVRFDLERLCNWFGKLEDVYWGSWCNWRYLDAMAMMYFWRIQDVLPELDNYKLTTVAAYLGLDMKGMAHDAAADIMVTRKIIHKVLEMI